MTGLWIYGMEIFMQWSTRKQKRSQTTQNDKSNEAEIEIPTNMYQKLVAV